MNGKCTFGCSYLKTLFYYSQKSKDQKVLHREVVGEGPEDRERREGEGAEGGMRAQSFGFLINSVWPSLSVF